MNKKTIILLALTCGVMYQDAGASEEHNAEHNEKQEHHHLFDGHIIHHVGDHLKKHVGAHLAKHMKGNKEPAHAAE